MALETEEAKEIQQLQIQTGIPRPTATRVRGNNRRGWTDVLEALQKTTDSSFVVSKAARPSVIATANRLGIKVATHQIDNYHVRVYEDRPAAPAPTPAPAKRAKKAPTAPEKTMRRHRGRKPQWLKDKEAREAAAATA